MVVTYGDLAPAATTSGARTPAGARSRARSCPAVRYNFAGGTGVLAGIDQQAYVDIDSPLRRVFGTPSRAPVPARNRCCAGAAPRRRLRSAPDRGTGRRGDPATAGKPARVADSMRSSHRRNVLHLPAHWPGPNTGTPMEWNGVFPAELGLRRPPDPDHRRAGPDPGQPGYSLARQTDSRCPTPPYRSPPPQPGATTGSTDRGTRQRR